MDKKKFREQYQTSWWIETSKRIKARDHNTCQMCGCNNKPLSVHHLYYGENGSIVVGDDALITLCEDCHLAQWDYRDCYNSLIGDMRRTMTDFELYQLLMFVNDNFCPKSNMPIELCSVEGKMQLRDQDVTEEFGDEVEKMHNLRKWRIATRQKRLFEDALWHYYIALHNGHCHDSKEFVEEWVAKTYGISVDEYIKTHQEKAREIENSALQHLKHIKKLEK